jgi:hypothetical protein
MAFSTFCTLIFIFFACNLEASFYKETQTHSLFSRGKENKFPLYCLNLPSGWEEQPIPEDNTDTMQPVALFTKRHLTLSIYNFPKEFPSAEMQTQRWIQKLKADPEEVNLSPFSCGGFYGLLLWAERGEEALFALALECDQEIASAIEAAEQDAHFCRQCTCSVTLKVQGPREELLFEKEILEKAFRSFRLQKEVHNLL